MAAGIDLTAVTMRVWSAVFLPLGVLLGRLCRERLGAALERQRALAAVAESSGDAVYAALADGTVVSWNPGAERLFGWTREEMVGGPITASRRPARRRS